MTVNSWLPLYEQLMLTLELEDPVRELGPLKLLSTTITPGSLLKMLPLGPYSPESMIS